MNLILDIPKKIIKHIKFQFTLFSIFTIILGNLGVFLPCIIFLFDFNAPKFSKTLLLDGALLLTVIPLASSSIYTILNNLSYSDLRRFRALKLIFIGILLVYIIVCVISYSQSMQATEPKFQHYFINILLYILGILLIYYAFLITFMENHYESFQEYDDQQVFDLVEKASSKNSEGDISL